MGVEQAREQRHQRDEEEIREGDAGERHREGEFLRVLREARREGAHDIRHADKRRREQRQLHDQHQGEDPVGEELRRRRPVRLTGRRVGRHEGGVEGALAEDGAEVVRQAQRHDEGVGDRADAHHGGDDDVADESCDPGDERPAADGQDLLQHPVTVARRRDARRG